MCSFNFHSQSLADSPLCEQERAVRKTLAGFLSPTWDLLGSSAIVRDLGIDSGPDTGKRGLFVAQSRFWSGCLGGWRRGMIPSAGRLSRERASDEMDEENGPETSRLSPTSSRSWFESSSETRIQWATGYPSSHWPPCIRVLL